MPFWSPHLHMYVKTVHCADVLVFHVTKRSATLRFVIFLFLIYNFYNNNPLWSRFVSIAHNGSGRTSGKVNENRKADSGSGSSIVRRCTRGIALLTLVSKRRQYEEIVHPRVCFWPWIFNSRAPSHFILAANEWRLRCAHFRHI